MKDKFLQYIIKTEARARFLLYAVFFLFVVGILYSVTLKTSMANLTEKQQSLKIHYSDLKDVKQAVKNLEVFLEDLQVLEKKFDMTLSQLPDDPDIQGVLRMLAIEAKSIDIDLIAFQPDQIIKNSFYDSLHLSLEFNGQYKNIVEFFSKVSRLDRIINISNISLKKNRQSQKLRVKAKATAFVFNKGASDET